MNTQSRLDECPSQEGRSFPPSLRGKGARGIGLSLLLLLSLSPAHADVFRCHSALQTETNRLIADISKAIQSCAISVRRTRSTRRNLYRAADQCERNLMKIYNVSGLPGRSAFDRFYTATERMHPRKCADTDLLEIGYFVPGVNAPGGRGPCDGSGNACSRDAECTARRDFCRGAMGDVARRLAALADQTARRAQLEIMPDLTELIAAVIDLEPGAEGELGTDDCSRPASSPPQSPRYRKRPNLCRLRPLLPCVARQCALSIDSNVTLVPLNLPIRLGAHSLPINVCLAPGPEGRGRCACPSGSSVDCNAGVTCAHDSDCGSEGTCNPELLAFSATSNTVTPPVLIPVDPPVTACVEIVDSQGWCDCGSGGAGQGAPFVPEVCIDHVIGADGKDGCGVSAVLLDEEDDCGCAVVAGVPQTEPLPDCATAACERCVQRGSDAPCHTGTRNGPLHQQWGGSSAPNDCLLQSTLRLSFVPPAFCRDAGGNVRGVCMAPGAADATCASLGGVSCVDARGPNGIACDADDSTPWTLFPVNVDFTTGTSTSRVADWIFTEGICTSPGHLNCVEDVNCSAGTCVGTVFGCGSGPGFTDCEVTAGPGAGISCANLRSGSMAGWKLVGTVPRVDQPAGIRDGLITLTLECE